MFRVKKLKETLVTVQQLDKNMSNLRSWLSRMEAELSRPITYSVCHHQEIQRRLAEQQVHRNTRPHISVTLLSVNDAVYCTAEFLRLPLSFVYPLHFSFCDIFLVVMSLRPNSIVCIVPC